MLIVYEGAVDYTTEEGRQSTPVKSTLGIFNPMLQRDQLIDIVENWTSTTLDLVVTAGHVFNGDLVIARREYSEHLKELLLKIREIARERKLIINIGQHVSNDVEDVQNHAFPMVVNFICDVKYVLVRGRHVRPFASPLRFFRQPGDLQEQIEVMIYRLLDSEEHVTKSAIPEVAEDAVDLLRALAQEFKQ